MPRTQSHAHKLKRHRYKSTGHTVFFCTLPDCNYKLDAELTLGKKIECWRCGKEFRQNEYSIRLAKPHCNACTKPKEVRGKIPEVSDMTNAIAAETTDNLKDRLSRTVQAFQGGNDEGEL